MAVAYNEEKVILEKLNNMVDNDYQKTESNILWHLIAVQIRLMILFQLL